MDILIYHDECWWFEDPLDPDTMVGPYYEPSEALSDLTLAGDHYI